MQAAWAEQAKNDKSNNSNDRTVGREAIALAGCYGQIGISAVAAAVRYQGAAKNPAYAPASSKWRDRIAEAAA
jgi:hypothetical protein